MSATRSRPAPAPAARAARWSGRWLRCPRPGGWRPVHALYNGRAEERARRGAAWYADPAHVLADSGTRAHARAVGRSRAFLRPELVADDAWHRDATVNELLRPLGVHDRLL